LNSTLWSNCFVGGIKWEGVAIYFGSSCRNQAVLVVNYYNSYSSEQIHTAFSEIHVVKDFANLTLKPWLEIYIYGNKKFDTCQRKMVLTLMISI
jgi:hypothetical protein